jgi:proteasome accessory factor A
MADRLFGLETEYAFALLNRKGQRISQPQATDWLLKAARRRLVHLPDLHSGGLFLANGARLYIDCGHHPEFAGPELANPWDAARYVKAGEKILEALSADLARAHDTIGQVCFFRQNVDYSGTHSTWGSHESYLHRNDPALFRKHLIPHLVSRLIYTGAGGFDSTHPGIRFTLSPRVPHLRTEVSGESTHSRGVLHTKDESLSASGYHRLHLLCSESLFSEWALFLRVGATALVVAMIEAGVRPGDQLALHAPLEAMRAFAADPSCRQAFPNGRGEPVTALAIQRRYLALAEARADASFMPPWAGEVCRQWRRVLDLLESGGPEAAATSLDWATRFSIIEKFLRDNGCDAQQLQRLNEAAKAIGSAVDKEGVPQGVAGLEVLVQDEKQLDELLPKLASRLRQKGTSLEDFKKFRALRSRVFELDTRFGQLGAAGLFSRLDAAGVLHHHFPGVDNFEHAVECPPAVGRANLRGACVRRLAADSAANAYACDWAAIWDRAQSRFLDLSDPFSQQESWKSFSPESKPDAASLLAGEHREILETLSNLRRRFIQP